MRPTVMPRILLIGDPIPDDAKQALEAAGFPVGLSSYGGIDPAEIAKSQLVILDVTPQTATTAQGLCRRWRIELGEHYVPIAWLGFDSVPALVTGALDAGADVCIPRPFTAAHLLAQAKALLRVEHMYSRSFGRASEAQQINQRLQRVYQQIDGDLEMVRRIHRGFLPQSLPAVHQARFSVCYRPRSRVGGDFYDLMRLDEENVAVYMGNAMGKGLPASSLLSIFVKKSLRTKEITGKSYRIIPANEVLAGLNRELVSLGMNEPPFVTMLYLQLNCRDGAVNFARAAHPVPLYVPATGAVEHWPATGSLLGAFDADFPLEARTLNPGDKLLLVSDGVNPTDATTIGADPLLETARRYQADELQAFVDHVSRDLLELSRSTDDFTMVGIEFR